MQDIEAINFQPPHQESTMDIDGGSAGASTATNKTHSSKLLTAAAGVIFLSASTVYAAFFLASETAAKNADLIQQQQSATMGKSSKAPRATKAPKAPKAPATPCDKASDLFAGYWCYSSQYVTFQLYLTTDFTTEGIGSLDYAVCDTTYSDAADIMLTSCSSSTEIRGEIRGSINDFKYVTDNTITVSTVFGPTTYTKGRCSCSVNGGA
ncbi:hypothetical protein QTG54_009215 [Skeletonema marinoi]|uniref:Uncharacterized protein n=1 Tax=Skeletonema marinoi TaxID=267567 RepID=A0AAD9DC07_9STRA|nr:hypothetical protein QTG54_009213 [Skeletonema marinoi]KAK1740265.1 hypothetical protein QTG54_009215 [Skeletonema marinoi]